MTRRVVVNADDYGRTRGVSSGIRAAHVNGLVSTTTSMINLPGAPDDLRQAMRETPHLGLGLHLNLTAGRAILAPERVPSLVDNAGLFFPATQAMLRLPALDPAQVEAEWQAQLEAFLATGATLDHLDSHHHIAAASPALWETCLRLASQHGCGVRRPLSSGCRSNSLLDDFPEAARRFALSDATEILRRSGVPCPDAFTTDFYGASATTETLERILRSTQNGWTEIMCHPGSADADLLASSVYAKEREAEAAALCDPRILQLADALGIRRCTYAEAILAQA
jgi:predicted glycoside hydrolase/deacetylase ChbG (UPF0249 family)